MSLGSNGVDGCFSCEKFRWDFVAWTFALVLSRFAPSFVRQPNSCKCTQIVENRPKHEFRIQWGESGAVVAKKFRCDFIAQTCPLIAPVQPILHRVSCSNETLPNAPKHYETHQNMSLWSNGVDRVCSLWKIPTRFHGTNLCINYTSSTHFAPSFV